MRISERSAPMFQGGSSPHSRSRTGGQVSVFAICGSFVEKTINFRYRRMGRAAFLARLHSLNSRGKNRGPQKRRSVLQSRRYARYSIFDNNSVRIRATGEFHWPPMKICHTCQQAYSDDVEFCPRDGALHKSCSGGFTPPHGGINPPLRRHLAR